MTKTLRSKKMKVTTIKFTQKVNTGKYESMEFSAEAIIDPTEDKVSEATELLADYVDWNAKKPLREETCRTYRALLAKEDTTPAKKAEATKWLAKYDERKAKMEAM
jgi:hypothetical protein